jgi:hypothetical protein
MNARGDSRLRKDKNVKTSTSALQKFSPDKPHLTNLTVRSQNPHRKDQTDKIHKSPDAGKKSPGGFCDTANTSFKKSPGKDEVKVWGLIFYYFFEMILSSISFIDSWRSEFLSCANLE